MIVPWYALWSVEKQRGESCCGDEGRFGEDEVRVIWRDVGEIVEGIDEEEITDREILLATKLLIRGRIILAGSTGKRGKKREKNVRRMKIKH